MFTGMGFATVSVTIVKSTAIIERIVSCRLFYLAVCFSRFGSFGDEAKSRGVVVGDTVWARQAREVDVIGILSICSAPPSTFEAVLAPSNTGQTPFLQQGSVFHQITQAPTLLSVGQVDQPSGASSEV